MNPDSSTRKRPQRLKDRLREAASEAILDAAQEVLLAQGFQAPMEVIAMRAGVAVGTLYNHFADRKTLVDSLLSRHRESMLDDVKAAEVAARTLPVKEQLVTMLAAMQGGWSRIFLIIRHSEQLPDVKKRAQLRASVNEVFGPVLERARREGVLAPDPHGLQVVALEGLMKSMFVFCNDEPKRLSPADAPRFVADTILHGFAPRRGGK